MDPKETTLPLDLPELLSRILSTVNSIQTSCSHLPAAVDAIQGQVNILAGIKQVRDAAEKQNVQIESKSSGPATTTVKHDEGQSSPTAIYDSSATRTPDSETGKKPGISATSRIILTTYPGQSGIDPFIMNWGHSDPLRRGPVIVSRNQTTMRRRNGRLSALCVQRPRLTKLM